MKKLITDKTLAAFEKWFYEKHGNCSKKYEELLQWQKSEIMDWVFNACDTIQHAFLIEFFMDHEILIITQPIDGWDCWYFSVLGKDIMSPFYEIKNSFNEDMEYDNPKDAKRKAIEAADEFFNNVFS